MPRTSLFTAAHRGGSGEPLLCIHGFTDTWRAWDLVLPALERRHDVLAPTLPGHAGGPPLGAQVGHDTLLDALERDLDAAGWRTAHVVGNSLGGYLALRLAARGRARSVVALAPGGGWADGDPSRERTFRHFAELREPLRRAAPQADAIVATEEGRRRATQDIAVHWEHIPTELLAHQIIGAAACDAEALALFGATADWELDAAAITCPVRIVWGTEDRLLPWPAAAARYRDAWLPHADWVVLDDVGHCPQLDVPLETAELILGTTMG